MKKTNIYFPCTLVEHEQTFSIICSNFHYFDDYFGEKESGGYALEKLAKKLVRENKIKGIKYNSEAGMFCAYSDISENLLQLCKLLREITGEKSEHLPSENVKPLISLDKAERLLLKGFVKSLDTKAQKEFLKNVPMPFLSKNQAKYLDNIQNGTDEEKIKSARKIDSEARTKTRDWNNYLSHPNTITILLEAIDKTENKKVYQALLEAIVFICGRHLPDLRTQPYFIKALKSKTARNRELGIWGLEHLYDYPFEEILPLMNDKSKTVKKSFLRLIGFKSFEYPSWMFNPVQSQVNKRPKDFSVFFPLFKDKNLEVQFKAIELIISLEENELFPKLRELIPIYNESLEHHTKENGVRYNYDYIIGEYKKVIERLKLIK